MVRLVMTAVVLAALAGAGAWAQPALPHAAGGAFSPAQRAEIVAIMREALRSDPSILRDAMAAMQQDDQRQQEAAARALIVAHRAALVSEADDPVAGAPAGDVTLVEFYDTRCPYCRRLLPTMAALVKADPNLRVVYKDLPILGPDSLLEARALLAAQRQGGYLRLQDALMRGSGPATMASVRAQAEAVGLDGSKLQQDMADPSIQARLERNLQLARSLHVEGTPAFVIGDRLIPGSLDLADLQEAVAAARAQ